MPKIKQIHLIGIGGAGMSGIAEVLFRSGYRVSGSDIKLTETTHRLAEIGIEIKKGHRASNIKGAEIIVFSSAIRGNNPELKAAQAEGLPVLSRSEMLAELMRIKYSIGIAGTHGKTTTTSMIGTILTDSGWDPTIVVGGRMRSFGTNARVGKSRYLVAEADEFEEAFLKLYPTVGVVTNIEEEHLEYYSGLEAIKEAFLLFINNIPFYGFGVLYRDDPNIQEIISQIKKPFITYSLKEGDFVAEDIKFTSQGSIFRVRRGKDFLGLIEVSIPGLHNLKNALAAVACCVELGVPFDKIKRSLREFKGVKRRFEVFSFPNSIILVDDFAHHPTEIEVTLNTARALWPKQRIIAIFQPHLYSRTLKFKKNFAFALSLADEIILTKIYPAREKPIKNVSPALIVESAQNLGLKNFRYFPDKKKIIKTVLKMLHAGDIIVTLGAGDIYELTQELKWTIENFKH